MGGKREVDAAAKRYLLGDLRQLPAVRLLVGVVLLLAGNIAFNAMVDETRATMRAGRGDGAPGVFTAYSLACSRNVCNWYGTFRADNDRYVTFDRIQLRGVDDDSLTAGDTVPALDVGSRDFVHRVGGSPEWGEAAATGFITVLAGSIAAGLVASVLLGVVRTRPSRSSRGREASGRSAVRDLVSRDRWGWTAWPGRSKVQVKMTRSWGRTVAVALAVLPLAAVTPPLCLYWFTSQTETISVKSVAGSWSLILMAVVVTVTIQTLRLVLIRPRMRVTESEVIIWDGLLLWKVLRIPRSGIAAVRHTTDDRTQDAARLTPFGEEADLVLRTRDAVRLPARRLRWGNWFWIMLSANGCDPRPAIPQRGRPVTSLWLRVKEPRRVATDLDRWLADDETPPPQLAPVDHAYYGRSRTHHGTGSTRLKIKGRLARPVLAEFMNEGSGTLRASLRRTGFGHGTPVISCGPGTLSAATVLDDRWVTDQVLTNRFLHIETEGPWTVTIGGPERSRSFARSTTGHGPEVLAYEGPPGIAVLTCPDGEPYQVHLRGPDLAGLYGRPVASAGGGFSKTNRSTFAVPSGSVLQVSTTSTNWRIDVTPLEQADVESVRNHRDDDTIPVPPTGHVRPFEGSMAGDRAAVVRYLGPPGRVLFRSEGGFGLVRLDPTLAPSPGLASPTGDQTLELRSHALVQVTGGSGTWTMKEAIRAR